MPDEIDLAQHAEELFLQNNLKQAQQAAAARKLHPRGKCYFCDARLEPVIENGAPVHKQLYCDHYCAEDHENEIKAKERAGR